MAVQRSTRPLQLIAEAKVAALLDAPAGRRLEASGVCAHDGAFYVIFDDLSGIARITDLSGPSDGNQFLDADGGGPQWRGFEDITYDPLNDHFYVLVEAVDHGGVFMAEVHEYDAQGRHLSRAVLEFRLPSSNKGLEGLSCIQRDGETFLLGLCEGNKCKSGAAGRTPGGGRIHVFARRRNRWRPVARIKLPKSVAFIDYASLAMSGDRIAVLSQSSAAVWIGTVTPGAFGVVDAGTIYEFPRDADGRVAYCNVEGVSWVGDQLVMVSDRADPNAEAARSKEQSIHLFAVPAPDRASLAAAAGTAVRPPPVLGLFQRRIAGDDALLRLARTRFLQAGLGAEVYAHDEDELGRILPFAPPSEQLPMVHLDRKLDLSRADDRDVVASFADHFAGAVSGFVVHDQRDMPAHTEELVGRLEELDRHLARVQHRPQVFLEYAAGHPVEWFAELGARLVRLQAVSLALDVGHIGIRQARRAFAAARPGLELTSLSATDPRLPELAGDVDAAVRTALPAVMGLIETLGPMGRPLHFHLHDGHPLIPGLQDHRSFLIRLPIPFEHDGRYSLAPLYGPAGLRDIVAAAARVATGGGAVTLTLEIHESDGRLPVHDVDFFGHWRDMGNAERMNHWLGVLADNAALVQAALGATGSTVRGSSS